MPELADALGGFRLDAQRNFVFAGRMALEKLKEEPVTAGENFYARFRHWFFADRATRAPSPFSMPPAGP
jgi:hypothetical protein